MAKEISNMATSAANRSIKVYRNVDLPLIDRVVILNHLQKFSRRPSTLIRTNLLSINLGHCSHAGLSEHMMSRSAIRRATKRSLPHAHAWSIMHQILVFIWQGYSYHRWHATSFCPLLDWSLLRKRRLKYNSVRGSIPHKAVCTGHLLVTWQHHMTENGSLNRSTTNQKGQRPRRHIQYPESYQYHSSWA